ncbi:MAG: TIGR00730 family Rossman fold protein [Candidatus Paceibacterota bacterium]
MNTQQKSNINVPAKDLPIEDKFDDFRQSFQWRVLRILAEFTNGFQFLADFNKIQTVTVFGSAVTKEDDPWYKTARELGELLAKNGYGVVTGGGPGIMEAVNRGAFEAGGESIGLNIQLPFEQRINPWVKKGIGFHYFFSRKMMLSYAAQAYVYFPGGFGTLDEFSELTTLIQTKKISQKIPIVLVGKDFWSPLLKWMKEYWVDKYHTITDEDLSLLSIVDTAEEALEIVKTAPHIKYF